MAKHDIVVLNSTSSGFETDLGNNVARIKGDADDLLSIRNSSEVSKFAVSSVENSIIVDGSLTLTGNLSSSLASTASFGRIDVTNLTGDASQMTNVNQIGHVSSSKQLAARISGAFQHGFELEGENRVISGSVTSTGSFTRVFANVYSGDASDMFGVDESGHFSGSAQLASDISGSFNKGFEFTGTISGSETSTGSFGRVVIGGVITGDASQVTGVDAALPSGVISSSAQLAAEISGTFNSGFQMEGTLSGSTSNSTASFGNYIFGSSVTISDVSELTGVPSTTDFVSSSAQIAADISGSFNKGFEFDGKISGSATSTGSFSRLNFNDINATDISGITNHEVGHIISASEIAADISASIQSGFTLEGTISGSSDSTLIVHKLDLSSTSFTIPNTGSIVKNWDSSYVRSAAFGDSLAADISGSFNKGLGLEGIGSVISGSVTSTGSFNRTQFKELFVKNIIDSTRKQVSGSMDHTIYISGSYKSNSSRPITIPVRGRVNHTMVTQQFTATGSMEDQTYRSQPGQFFVDNWGRLNITVQTGSMVAQPAAWTLVGSGDAMGGRVGGMIAQSTKAALVLPGIGMGSSDTRLFDGITVFAGASLVRDQVHCGWSHAYQGLGNGVDDGLFAGGGFGGGMGRHGQFYDGSSWSMLSVELPQDVYSSNGQPKAFNAPGVTTGGGGALVGGTNRCKVYEWTGVSWEIGGTRNVNIGGGGAAGTVYAGLAFGGDEAPSSTATTCTEEYNGISWATANAMPHGLDTVGAGTQNAAAMAGGATVAPHGHGPYGASDDTFEYNGTSWNSAVDMLSYMTQHNMAGGTGTLISGPGLHGWTNGIGAIFEPGFVTGSSETYNDFQPAANGDGRYLFTKKLQANYSPGTAGGVTSGSSDGYGGGY